MTYLIYLISHELAAAVILVPVLVLWQLLLQPGRRIWGYGSLALYLAAVYFLTGLPTLQFHTWEVTLNLLPFVGIAADWKNALLNIALFIPLGFLLPLLWRQYRSLAALAAFGFALSLAIELSQLFVLRATDVNDLITNTLGAVLGWLLARPFPPSRETDRRPLAAVCILVGSVMFLVHSPLAEYLYRIAA